MNHTVMFQHPDSLFDQPYEEVDLKQDDYITPEYNFGKPEINKTGITMHGSEKGYLRVDACSKNIIRIRFSPNGSSALPSVTEELNLIKKDWEGCPFEHHVIDGVFSVKTESVCFEYSQGTNEFLVKDDIGIELLKTVKGGVRFSKELPDYSGNRSLAYFDFKDETIFGFGGRIMNPNRTGTTVDVFSEKAGCISGDYGGTPIPFFISSKGYGFFFNNPWPHVYFDMGKTNKEEWFLNAPGGDFDVFILKGDSFKDIMHSYTEIAGRIPVPDKWLLGFWCSSICFEEASKLLDDVKRLHGEGYPCDVVVLDGAWRGGKNFLKSYTTSGQYPSNDMNWHEDFGDGPAMIKELLDQNVKTSLHVNSRNFSQATIEYAVQKGLLRQQMEETVVKLTDKTAEEYYKDFLRPRINEGVAVWWTDHADRVSGEIKPGLPSRNLFGALWNRLISESMKEKGINNHLCLTRGSGIGGQRYGFPWPGDTRFGIEYFEEDIWFCLGAGLAGFPLTSVDVGGFTIEKTGENNAFDEENICRRTIQSMFFVPVPRIHNGQHSIPKLPWNCPEKSRELYKECLKARYELIPYIYSYAVNAAKTGEPILRPLVYHHVDDEKTYDIGNEFYMGENLLIAPVTEKGARSREVYLPEGEWTHLWTGVTYKGKRTVTVDAPLYELRGLPVFVKKGAIIVKQPFTLTLTNEIPPELTLEIYPDDMNSITLWESETISNTFSYQKMGEDLHLSFENNTNIDRQYIVKIMGGGTLTVPVPANTAKSVTM